VPLQAVQMARDETCFITPTTEKVGRKVSRGEGDPDATDHEFGDNHSRVQRDVFKRHERIRDGHDLGLPHDSHATSTPARVERDPAISAMAYAAMHPEQSGQAFKPGRIAHNPLKNRDVRLLPL